MSPSVCQHQGAPLSSHSRRLKSEVTRGISPESPHTLLCSQLWALMLDSLPGGQEPVKRSLMGQEVSASLRSLYLCSFRSPAGARTCSLALSRVVFHCHGFGLGGMFLCLPPRPSPRVFRTCFSADAGTLVLVLLEAPCNCRKKLL